MTKQNEKRPQTEAEYQKSLQRWADKIYEAKEEERLAQLSLDPWSVRDRRERYAPFGFLLRHDRIRDREMDLDAYKRLLQVLRGDYRGVRALWGRWFRTSDIWSGAVYRKMVLSNVTFEGLYVMLRAAYVMDRMRLPGAPSVAEFAARYVVGCFPSSELVVIAGSGR